MSFLKEVEKVVENYATPGYGGLWAYNLACKIIDAADGPDDGLWNLELPARYSKTGEPVQFQVRELPPAAEAAADPRVLAVRDDPKIGRTSCSHMAEAMTDPELLQAILDAGAKTPKQAVKAMRRLDKLLWDHSRGTL